MDDNTIIKKIKIEETRAKGRMFLYASIPIIITIILVIFSWRTVDDANSKVNELNKKLEAKNDTLEILEERYEFAVNYLDKRYYFNYSIDKELYSRYPNQSEIVQEVRHLMRNNEPKWKLGGNSVLEGFDSPSFAAYLLNRYSRTHILRDKIYKLYEYLPRINQPRVGDIIFYEYGYTMFYFEYNNEPFCVGMTPIGASSLELNFGPNIIGYGKVEY